MGPTLAYQSYINSEAWQVKKRQYRRSHLPQRCVICGSRQFDLHHKTYKRLGQEYLTDLLPLCREHHDQIKIVQRQHPHWPLRKATRFLVRAIYGRTLNGRKRRKWSEKDKGPRLHILR